MKDIVGFEVFIATKFTEVLLYLNRMELPCGNNSSPEMTWLSNIVRGLSYRPVVRADIMLRELAFLTSLGNWLAL